MLEAGLAGSLEHPLGSSLSPLFPNPLLSLTPFPLHPFPLPSLPHGIFPHLPSRNGCGAAPACGLSRKRATMRTCEVQAGPVGSDRALSLPELQAMIDGCRRSPARATSFRLFDCLLEASRLPPWSTTAGLVSRIAAWSWEGSRRTRGAPARPRPRAGRRRRWGASFMSCRYHRHHCKMDLFKRVA